MMGERHTVAGGRRADVIGHRRAQVRSHLLALAVCLLALAAVAPGARAASLENGFCGPAEVDGVSQFPIYDDLGVRLYQLSISWAHAAPTRPATRATRTIPPTRGRRASTTRSARPRGTAGSRPTD